LRFAKPAEDGQATSSAASLLRTMAKALFYTELRPKRNLPGAELIEVGRNAPSRIRFAEAVQ